MVGPIVIEVEHGSENRQRFTRKWRASIVELVLCADVDRGVVEVVLNSRAVDELDVNDVFAHEFDFRLESRATPRHVSASVETVGRDLIPMNVTHDAREFDVTPVAHVLVADGEIRIRKARVHVRQIDAIRVHAGICACPWTLERHGEVLLLSIDGIPVQLSVPEKQHPVRAPVVENVREDVIVHELTRQLTAAELTELAVRVSQPNRRLPCIGADAEHVDLEARGDVAMLRRQQAFDAEPALARTHP